MEQIVGTTHPDAVFGAPSNGSWPTIYHYYWHSIIPLSLFLWALAIGVIIFFESTSHLFSSYHRTKLKKRAFSGLLGILSWWWLAALSLRFASALSEFITPSLSSISLFQTMSFGGMGVLGTIVAMSADFMLFVLLALVYLVREVMLYLFVLLMPILIALWTPGVGPLTLVSRFVRRMAGYYVPFLFMTVPVAMLFRLGKLLGADFGLSMSGVGNWLIALVLPLLALFAPLVLLWQAGAVFFVADRASRRFSTNTARRRMATAQAAGSDLRQGQQHFVAGVRGEPPTTDNGQYLLSSNGSGAHRAGSRIASTTSQLRSTFGGADASGTAGSGTGAWSGGSDGERSGTGDDSTTAATDDGRDRNQSFDMLRERDTRWPTQPQTDDKQATDTNDE